jgi:hypothetical protein
MRFAKYISGDEIKEGEISGVCGIFVEEEEFIQGFDGDMGKITLYMTYQHDRRIVF